MPAFSDLPAPTIKGLVHLVRMMNADRGSTQPGAGAAGAPNDNGGAATKPAASSKKAHPPANNESSRSRND